MTSVDVMATAVSKPTSHPPKMKRPPPPFVQNGVNGVKHSHVSSSPQATSKRLPGTNQSVSTGTSGSAAGPTSNFAGATATSMNNVMNKGLLGRAKKDAMKSGEQSSRLQRQSTRVMLSDHSGRVLKHSPEPYGKFHSTLVANRRVRLRFGDWFLTIASFFFLFFPTVHSQNNVLYPEEICEMFALSHRSSVSNAFPIRTAGWQFPV